MCGRGHTFLWGNGLRYMEKDFRMRSTYGTVEGSTLDDWPISYQDLEPYYEKAEWEIGVSGDDSNNIFRAPRKRAIPMGCATWESESASFLFLCYASERI